MEGCGYRDLYEDFEALGVRIVGVSFDSVDANADFAAREGFQYELWSDLDHTLGEYYGADGGFGAARVTKLLDAEGDLILHYVDAIDVGTHPADVLADCQAIF